MSFLHKPNLWNTNKSRRFLSLQTVLMLIKSASIAQSPVCDDGTKNLKVLIHWVQKKACQGSQFELSDFTVPTFYLHIQRIAAAKEKTDSRIAYIFSNK